MKDPYQSHLLVRSMDIRDNYNKIFFTSRDFRCISDSIHLLNSYCNSRYVYFTKIIYVFQELLVRLTDDSDPFFLFTCIVCEEDYHALRQSQGLLIDFSAFPHKFVELVNTCIRESDKDSPK